MSQFFGAKFEFGPTLHHPFGKSPWLVSWSGASSSARPTAGLWELVCKIPKDRVSWEFAGQMRKKLVLIDLTWFVYQFLSILYTFYGQKNLAKNLLSTLPVLMLIEIDSFDDMISIFLRQMTCLVARFTLDQVWIWCLHVIHALYFKWIEQCTVTIFWISKERF